MARNPATDLARALTDKARLRAFGEELGVRFTREGHATARELHEALTRADLTKATDFTRGYVAGLFDVSTGAVSGLRAREALVEESRQLLPEKLFSVLRALATERRTPTEITALLGDRDPSTVSRQLKTLLGKRLIEAGPAPADARQTPYRITFEGEQVLAQLPPVDDAPVAPAAKPPVYEAFGIKSRYKKTPRFCEKPEFREEAA